MYSDKSKKQNRFSIFKLLSIFVLFILLGFTTNIYLNSQYESLTSSFYNNFNNSLFIYWITKLQINYKKRN